MHAYIIIQRSTYNRRLLMSLCHPRNGLRALQYLSQPVLGAGNKPRKSSGSDKAHKYMTEDSAFTESLLSVIRLQRHIGTGSSYQLKSLQSSTRFLDLCSVTVVHRFSSPQ
jgi:hypothetical protein